MMTKSARPRSAFRCSVRIEAGRERVFGALATIEGIRGWWTPVTGGSAAEGGHIRLEFPGTDECIIMQVDRALEARSVHWTCKMHTGLPEWEGTQLKFELVRRTARSCDLRFRHAGLTPRLACYDDCRHGWDHFLASLASYAETGAGRPFGS